MSQELRDQFAQSRTSLNEFLEASAQIQLAGETLTNRRVLEVFVYGGLAHANAVKKAEFDKWSRDPMLFGMLQVLFNSVVIELLRFLLWAYAHNERTLAELSSDPSPA